MAGDDPERAIALALTTATLSLGWSRDQRLPESFMTSVTATHTQRESKLVVFSTTALHTNQGSYPTASITARLTTIHTDIAWLRCQAGTVVTLG